MLLALGKQEVSAPNSDQHNANCFLKSILASLITLEGSLLQSWCQFHPNALALDLRGTWPTSTWLFNDTACDPRPSLSQGCMQ